ncbi:hypothetical protein B0H66DRAFT_570413 [Apodospora peruviana]|uniref:SET domain-containing protein n=1 Tax=Apodospora peruviana TaxID=516989 RepID=A0AAE0HTH3_9PEZI|nr:hypothetical protein B0H66DRAFT_570413 [Apodospora peruviana]
MKASYLLTLAPCAVAAVKHYASAQSPLGNTKSCLWRPPPPLGLACGVDEVDLSLPQKSQATEDETSSSKSRNNNRTVEPTKSIWEGPVDCLSSYCIFFNSGFANGRGIVAITTTANVDKLKSIDVAITSSHDTTVTGDAYTVSEVAGKGLGMIASTPLRRGDTIMQKTPALLVHRGFLESIPPSQAQRNLLDAAAELIPSPLKEGFFDQMAHMGGQVHKIVDIMGTNSFQMDLGGQDGHHYGNYPEVSRYNHDCRPNVVFYIDKETLMHTTTVVRQVKPGEELTISYLDPLKPRAHRRHRAHLAWGFGCACPQCSLPDKEADKSDERLEEIARIEAQLADIYDKKVNVKMLKRLAALYEEERLEAKVANGYTMIALNANMLGQEKMAKEYAARAREAVLLEHGPADTGGDAAAMADLARDPKGHFTWRARINTR